MKVLLRRLLLNCNPYIFISLAGIMAFAPVSFMIFSLKNDIVALDYPIKYFISQCLHNNIQPFWFNTWAMGFPLESIITWSFFSPLQFFFSLFFEYDLYTLHAEFVCYIAFSGCSIFYLLNRHLSPQKKLNAVLATCYMLSGFMVGSSQWMTYLTASAFLPLVMASFFSLLKTPSIKSSLVFVAVFYIMLTSAYPAFTIITIYVLLICTLLFLLKEWRAHRKYFVKIFGVLTCTLLLMALLYSPAIISSFRVLEAIDRGSPISSFSEFFNSNYFHPSGIQTLLLPFSSTRLTAQNTEGTMLDCYMGLLPLLLLPLSIYFNFKNRSGKNFLLLAVSIGFLLLSFGSLTPLRSLINFLPGFSYFRNPALFRLFFTFFILVYLSRTFQCFGLNSLLSAYTFAKYFRIIILTLTLVMLLVMILCREVFTFFPESVSLKGFLNNVSLNDTLFISAFIQFIFLALIYLAHRKKPAFLYVLFMCDLTINCFICTPFFTVSSYSVEETNEKIFQSRNGFPVQAKNVGTVSTSYHHNNASWYNVNVYRKEVSGLNSYFGPLVLKTYTPTEKNDQFFNNQILFTTNREVELNQFLQQPNNVSALVKTQKPVVIFFQQNLYKGWHAYFNNQEIAITSSNGKMSIAIPRSGKIEFRYERTTLFIVAIAINMLVLAVLIYCAQFKLIKLYKSLKLSQRP